MDSSSEPGQSRNNSTSLRRRYFAQRIVYPWELPSIMRKHIYTGAMGNIYGSLISGVFFVYFGTQIGLSPFQWSLMAGISSFLLSAELIAARVTQLAGRRKALWFWFAVASRAVRLLGILIAFFLWHSGLRHAGVILIAAIALSNFLGAMANPPWMSWLADIIPKEHHGGFWGRRNWWIAVAVAAASVPAGFLIDRMSDDHKLAAATAIFLAVTVIGMLDLVIHGTIPEPAMVVPKRQQFVQQLLEPLRDAGYRPWLVFNASWTFSMTLGGALATIYFVDDLRIKDSLLWGQIVLGTVPIIGNLLVSRRAGRLVDALGPKRVLSWGHFFWSFLPLFWVISTPRTALFWLGCSSLVGGLSSSSAATAANKLITRFPPPGHRVATYTAVSSCMGSLAGSAGVLTAGAVLKLLGDWSVDIGGTTFGAFRLLFAVSLLLRLASASLLIRRIRDPQPA